VTRRVGDAPILRQAWRIAGFVLVMGLAIAGRASAETFWGLTTAQTLVRFTSTAPGTILANLPVTGLPSGERLIAINISDFNGWFLGISSAGRLYTLDRHTGAATHLAAQTGRIIAPSGTAFALVRDPWGRLELMSNTGQRILMPADFNSEDFRQVLQHPFPAGARIVTAADHYFPQGGRAALLDSGTDWMYNEGAPGGLTPIGPLGIDISDEAGLAKAINEDNGLFAALTVGGVPGLYRVALNGQATFIGTIASEPITSLAADREGLEIIATPSVPPGGGSEWSYFLEGTDVTFTLQRIGDDAAPVDYAVTALSNPWVNGTDDVVLSQPTVHFAAGEREKSVTVSLLNDTLRESIENFQLSVAEINPTGRGTFQTGRLIYIVDDDNRPPVLTITAPSAPVSFSATNTVTISGFVTDDRPGVRVYFYNNAEVPSLSTTSNPFTFANVPSWSFLGILAVDADGAQATAVLRVLAGAEQTFVLAEGATGEFFRTDLVFANPDPIDVPVAIDFLREDGSSVPFTLMVPARQRATLDVGSVPGLEATAAAAVARVAAGNLAVERTMRWDASGYGASSERASSGLSTTWHFAEGAQGFFSTFLLLVNPQTSSNVATVRFLRDTLGPITRTYTLAPRSRLTIDAGGIAEIVNHSFGMEVTFAQPALAERSMYFGSSPLWSGGHASAGATALSTSWLLAEGATGSFFETFVLVANPSDQPADVTFTFLPTTGAPVTRIKQIPPNGRLTVDIEQEDPALANAAVGTRVTSNVPIVVERSQYWPYTADGWYEAHNSVGQTVAVREWTLSEGRTGGPEGYQTYILLANPDPDRGTSVSLTFLRDDGDDVVLRSAYVPPASRVTVSVDPSQIPELSNARFSTHVTSSIPIVVERSMYSNANGQFWAAGTNAPGTPRPF